MDQVSINILLLTAAFIALLLAIYHILVFLTASNIIRPIRTIDRIKGWSVQTMYIYKYHGCDDRIMFGCSCGDLYREYAELYSHVTRKHFATKIWNVTHAPDKYTQTEKIGVFRGMIKD